MADELALIFGNILITSTTIELKGKITIPTIAIHEGHELSKWCLESG
jgi:hypothetical protein